MIDRVDRVVLPQTSTLEQAAVHSGPTSFFQPPLLGLSTAGLALFTRFPTDRSTGDGAQQNGIRLTTSTTTAIRLCAGVGMAVAADAGFILTFPRSLWVHALGASLAAIIVSNVARLVAGSCGATVPWLTMFAAIALNGEIQTITGKAAFPQGRKYRCV